MLNELEKRNGVTGLETPVADLVKENLPDFCQDAMGNLIVKKCGKDRSKKLLLAVHMDEPGVIVTQITEKGYLKFDLVGRLKPELLAFRRVDIHGISGVIALKAVHLTKKEERETPIKLENLYIDIGAATKAEAEAHITAGDYGAIESEPFSMGEDLQKGKAWGSRVGCMLAMDLLQEELPVDMEVVFTTQRELGGRGLQTAAFQSEADTAIILDGVPADEDENTPKCGNGGVWVIPVGEATQLPKAMKEQAKPLQVYVAEEKGQEMALLKSKTIRRTICLGIPVRYSKTPVQVVSKQDIDALKRLLKICIQEYAKEGTK
ncbi:MAG: hypothetical protein IJB80_07215 [Clostridia bacterium]|nr:hypothetical protein [Clostridia bacterium]